MTASVSDWRLITTPAYDGAHSWVLRTDTRHRHAPSGFGSAFDTGSGCRTDGFSAEATDEASLGFSPLRFELVIGVGVEQLKVARQIREQVAPVVADPVSSQRHARYRSDCVRFR